MENGGSLNPNDLATLSLLRPGYGSGPGVYGGGAGGSLYAGNNVLAAEAHANGTALASEVKCNRESFKQGLDTVTNSFEDGRRESNFNIINDKIGALASENARTQLFFSTQMNDVRSEFAKCCCETKEKIAEAAKEAAKCCCDAKLQACKDTSDLKALIIQENSETRELIRGDALAAANAKIVQLETINALSGHGHR